MGRSIDWPIWRPLADLASIGRFGVHWPIWRPLTPNRPVDAKSANGRQIGQWTPNRPVDAKSASRTARPKPWGGLGGREPPQLRLFGRLKRPIRRRLADLTSTGRFGVDWPRRPLKKGLACPSRKKIVFRVLDDLKIKRKLNEN